LRKATERTIPERLNDAPYPTQEAAQRMQEFPATLAMFKPDRNPLQWAHSARQMDDIEGAISVGKVDLEQARATADTISIFLMAFPHLFPPAPNQWKPGGDRDPATDTFASPDVWSRWTDFYRQALPPRNPLTMRADHKMKPI
jgi:hypothetical protein